MAVWVSPTGSVEKACVVESTPAGLFDVAALQSVAHWRFKTKLIEGAPAAQLGLQAIEFQIK